MLSFPKHNPRESCRPHPEDLEGDLLSVALSKYDLGVDTSNAVGSVRGWLSMAMIIRATIKLFQCGILILSD